MKKALLLFGLLIAISGFSQENLLEESIKKQLKFEEEDYYRFEVKTLPNNKNLSIAAIAKYNGPVDESSFDCDLILALVDNTSQKIIDRYVEEKKFSSDSYQLSYVTLDMANYKVTDEIRAFGIRVGFEGSSRVYPSWDNSLSLFIIEKNKIKKILDTFPMDELHGDWDIDCKYDGEKTTSVAIMQSNKTNGFYDIAIKTTKTISKSRAPKKKGDPCIETETKDKPTTQLLQFVKGKYQLKK